MPDIKAEQGTPQQKPRGEAKRLNEELGRAKALKQQADTSKPLISEGERSITTAPPEEMPEFASPDQEGAQDQATTGDSEEDGFLFEDPPEGTRDDGSRTHREPVPQSVIDGLPDLIAASRDPSAPPQLALLVQLLADRLGA